MIIATIGSNRFKLKDFAAAEQLMKILAESIPVDNHYMSKKGYVYSASDDAPELNLSIVQGDLLTDEELKKLQAPAINKD